MKLAKIFLLVALLSFVNAALAASSDEALDLSLQEAILLAVRENPNIEVAQLNLVQQKFALYVQQWMFTPQLSLSASMGAGKSIVNDYQQTTHNVQIQPGVSWLSPVGTKTKIMAPNNISGHFHPGLSIEIVQPLMRGFGRPIVEAALYNAMDSEVISRLNVENTLRNTVTGVVVAYLGMVAAESTVRLDQAALERAEQSVHQTRLFIKAGHKAGNELVTVESDVASAEASLENDKNNLQQARYALLTAIGLDPNTPIRTSAIDVAALIKKYEIPTQMRVQALALKNDIQYQTDQITLEGATKRSLQIAEDNTRWQLDLTLNATTGQGTGAGPNAGVRSLYNGTNQTQSAQLNLQIPLNDQVAKQGVLNAKIALREATLALKQEKWLKQTNAINGWNSVSSAERALHFAENAANLQQKTYQLSNKKYYYGLINSIELQSVRQQLNATQQSYVASQLNYLTALANLDLLVGNTLKTWDIRVRFQ